VSGARLRAADRGSATTGITIGGGGSVSVADVALYDAVARLGALAETLRSCGRSLAVADGLVVPAMLVSADAPLSAMRAEEAVRSAVIRVAAAEHGADALRSALSASAISYGLAERGASELVQHAAAALAARMGLVGALLRPLLLPFLVGVATIGGSAFALARVIAPDATAESLDALAGWLHSHRALLSDPLVVEAVRYTVMSVDDGLGGQALLPPPVVALLGDEGLGLAGVDTSAVAVAAAAGLFGALRETKSEVTAGATTPATPPSGFAERAARVPSSPTQIRVDRLVRPGEPDRFEVYVAGTADFAPVPGAEPWDLTSNVTALAGGEAGSYRALETALADAGVTAESPLTVTGYSQGGLLAAELAASDDYRVEALYTMGAPAGQVVVPDSVPWIAVEHTDDVVPALGGTTESADPLLVRRKAFADRPLDDRYLFPAHQLEYYRETAALVDGISEPRVVALRERLDASAEGVTRVESTLYSARRLERE